MDADHCNVAELFQQAKRHVVPLYQRSYVWDETEQWKPLWEDVAELAERIFEGQPAPSHFLGAVVRTQAPSTGLRLDAKLVIDGQQRLTTLQVLIAVLRDRVRAVSEAAQGSDARTMLEQLGQSLASYTENTGVVRQPIERFKVWPTNADRDAFQDVMAARSREALDAKYEIKFTEGKKPQRLRDPRLLVEAYRFFDDQLTSTLADTENDELARTRLLEAFVMSLERLMLVIIDLGDDDDAQEIFETLNFRGAPLRASDLVKNFVLSRAAVARQGDPEGLYLEYWRGFDAEDEGGRFWKTEIVQGRLRRPIFDAFLEHYLQCRSEDGVSSRHVYQAFRKWWDARDGRKVPEELAELRRYADVYRSFYDPSRLRGPAPRVALFLQRLRALDTTTVYPLLLFVLAELEFAPADRDAIVTDLESYLVRRAICGLTQKNMNRVTAALVRDLRAAGAVTLASFRERLRQFKGVDRWPTDKDLEDAWLRDPVYKRMKSRGIQMVLRAVHDTLLGPKQEAVELPENLTVEHVMPQTWEDHWAPPDPAGGTADENAIARRERLIHTMGNLTLLTGPLNADGDVSNKPFTVKRDAIAADSLLLLNHYFAKLDRWDEEAIVARGRHLLERARRIWNLT